MIDSAFNSKSVSSSVIFNTDWLNFRNNSKRYCDIFFKKQIFISNQIQNIFFTACHFPTILSLLISNTIRFSFLLERDFLKKWRCYYEPSHTF